MIMPEIIELMRLFTGSFINSHEELILNKKYNIYFRLEDIKNPLDLKMKIISWVSRAACKGIPEKDQKLIREGLNIFLHVNFDKEGWATIYTYLGNDCNRSLCRKFILKDFDIKILPQ